MSKVIRREIVVPQGREEVWRALTDSGLLAEWMFPNDFEAKVGHAFTFKVPGNPAVKFEGLTVRCQVLACEPPERLEFSWSAGGAVENTRVSYRLVSEGAGTRLFGTIDGVKTDAAGLVGFRKPEGADEKAYEKLVQKPYDDGWIAFQNIGNHVGCMSEPFAENVIAPMLIEDERGRDEATK